MAVITPRFLPAVVDEGRFDTGGVGGAGESVGAAELLAFDASGFGARSRTAGRIEAGSNGRGSVGGAFGGFFD